MQACNQTDVPDDYAPLVVVVPLLELHVDFAIRGILGGLRSLRLRN